MRRITLAVLATVSIIVLLFSYRTSLGGGSAAQPAERAHVVSGSAAQGGPITGQGPEPTAGPAAAGPSGAGSGSGAGSSAAAPGSTVATPAPAASTVIDGDVETTRYGPVQVQVTIAAGTITEVTAIQYPTAQRRDREINSFALPQLRTEVLAAQSARVDAVSGATFTTDGYLASLQSALDAAHFG